MCVDDWVNGGRGKNISKLLRVFEERRGEEKSDGNYSVSVCIVSHVGSVISYNL